MSADIIRNRRLQSASINISKLMDRRTRGVIKSEGDNR